MNFAGLVEYLDVARKIRKITDAKIHLLQNTQAVTSFQFTSTIKQDFRKAGVDNFLLGNPLDAFNSIIGKTSKEASSGKPISYRTSWTHLQIECYNGLPYSHGPKTSSFVPILTSLGCPFGCDFCVVPSLSNRKWLFKSPEKILDEMESYQIQNGITHFQIEDLNPTVSWPRWESLCGLLASRNFTYSLVSGTKAETIPIEKVSLLAQSGCKYLSISPESGSPDLMKKIGKQFDHVHALQLVKALRRSNIRSQACFLVGHPKERMKDKSKTIIYLFKLAWAGIDEVAFFTVAPHPGSNLVDTGLLLQNNDDVVTFSGSGRSNPWNLRVWRLFCISAYAISKLLHPMEFAKAIIRTIQMTPETKTENIIARINYLKNIEV